MSMAANTQVISNPTANDTWDTITAKILDSWDELGLSTFETMSFKIEEFKYDSQSRTLFGYLAVEAPTGDPNYPQRVHLYRSDEDMPRVKSDEFTISSWPQTLDSGETYMQYIDSTTTSAPIHIRLYPTRKLRDFWFAMYRSVRVESK